MDIEHVLQLVGYHVACIMDRNETRISCSPHPDMPVFERDLTGTESREYVRRQYMKEVSLFLFDKLAAKVL